MKTILVAVDFSAHAIHTARFGVELAHQIGGHGLLLHVVETAPRVPMMGANGRSANLEPLHARSKIG